MFVKIFINEKSLSFKISEWFAAANGGFAVSTSQNDQNSIEDSNSVETQLRSLLNMGNGLSSQSSLTDLKQISRFSRFVIDGAQPYQILITLQILPTYIRIMNKASDSDSDMTRCLQIICNTKSEICLLAFVAGTQ